MFYTAVVPISEGHLHPKTLIEIAMALSTNSGSFPSNSHVSVTFSILLRFGEFCFARFRTVLEVAKGFFWRVW